MTGTSIPSSSSSSAWSRRVASSVGAMPGQRDGRHRAQHRVRARAPGSRARCTAGRGRRGPSSRFGGHEPRPAVLVEAADEPDRGGQRRATATGRRCPVQSNASRNRDRSDALAVRAVRRRQGPDALPEVGADVQHARALRGAQPLVAVARPVRGVERRGRRTRIMPGACAPSTSVSMPRRVELADDRDHRHHERRRRGDLADEREPGPRRRRVEVGLRRPARRRRPGTGRWARTTVAPSRSAAARSALSVALYSWSHGEELVARLEAERGEDRRHAGRRVVHEREALGVRVEERRATSRAGLVEQRLELAAQEPDRLPLHPVAPGPLRLEDRLRARAERAVVEVRDVRLETPRRAIVDPAGHARTLAHGERQPLPGRGAHRGPVARREQVRPPRPGDRPRAARRPDDQRPLVEAEPGEAAVRVDARCATRRRDAGRSGGARRGRGRRPSPSTGPRGVHSRSASAIAPALAPARHAPRANARRAAAQAAVPPRIAGIRSGSPPGRWTRSAAASSAAFAGSAADAASTTIAASTADRHAGPRRRRRERPAPVRGRELRTLARGRRRDQHDPHRPVLGSSRARPPPRPARPSPARRPRRTRRRRGARPGRSGPFLRVVRRRVAGIRHVLDARRVRPQPAPGRPRRGRRRQLGCRSRGHVDHRPLRLGSSGRRPPRTRVSRSGPATNGAMNATTRTGITNRPAAANRIAMRIAHAVRHPGREQPAATASRRPAGARPGSARAGRRAGTRGGTRPTSPPIIGAGVPGGGPRPGPGGHPGYDASRTRRKPSEPPRPRLDGPMGPDPAAPRRRADDLDRLRRPAPDPAALLHRARRRHPDARDRHGRVAGGPPRGRADLRLAGGPGPATAADDHRAPPRVGVRGPAAVHRGAGRVRGVPRAAGVRDRRCTTRRRAAYLVDANPPERHGEAFGIYGSAQTGGSCSARPSAASRRRSRGRRRSCSGSPASRSSSRRPGVLARAGARAREGAGRPRRRRRAGRWIDPGRRPTAPVQHPHARRARVHRRDVLRGRQLRGHLEPVHDVARGEPRTSSGSASSRSACRRSCCRRSWAGSSTARAGTCAIVIGIAGIGISGLLYPAIPAVWWMVVLGLVRGDRVRDGDAGDLPARGALVAHRPHLDGPGHPRGVGDGRDDRRGDHRGPARRRSTSGSRSG